MFFWNYLLVNWIGFILYFAIYVLNVSNIQNLRHHIWAIGRGVLEYCNFVFKMEIWLKCVLKTEIYTHFTASLLKVLKIPGIMLAAASIIVTSMSIGFLSATLEPHLRQVWTAVTILHRCYFCFISFFFQFNLSPMVLGLMFVINGGTYALTAPWWGWLCDKVVPAKVVTLLGCIILMIGFSLIGPVPFIGGPT